MKELSINDYKVKDYLTYAEIQAICDAVCKEDSWSARQETLDFLLVHFATNMTNDEVEELGHDQLLCSGFIDNLKQVVKNYNRIQEAIDYTESTQRALAKIVKELPTMLEPLKDVANRANKSSKK